MQCQECKQQTATIHLTEIHDGQRIETHLCQNCAHKQGLALQTQIPVNELLSTLLNASEEGSESSSSTAPEKACPHCGMTIKRFTKENLLGCPHDYEVFEKNLLPLIERSQNGKTQHEGKIPSSVGADQKKQIQLSTLKRQLEQAVRNEDYETAARLRDEIKEAE